jgi:lycopene cyclase domain-containing protein
MPYGLFLLVFLVLPTGMLLMAVRPRRLEWLALGLMAAAAYGWAVPWDNHMASIGLWQYSSIHVVGIWLGRVPLEEYLFFGLMVLLGGAWVLWLDRRVRERSRGAGSVLVWLPAAAIGLAVGLSSSQPAPPGARPWTYLLWLLGPAAPVILLQLLVGGRILARRWMPWAAGVLVPAVYLTAAEAAALQAGIWRLDPGQTLNLFLPGGVPVEELVFFLAANAMIVQGVLLVTSPELRSRWNAWVGRRKTAGERITRLQD